MSTARQRASARRRRRGAARGGACGVVGVAGEGRGKCYFVRYQSALVLLRASAADFLAGAG
ncbi:hypothetical protein, partial [Burkholderia glumae]|uniref:hypothetical protein n=1 Tax=Burkholderia glumae TaxID=337 RepID=UPI0019D6E24E